MERNVVTASANASILTVQRLIVRNRVGRVVVTDAQGIPIGIVTQKDMVRFLPKILDTTLEEVPVSQVMTAPLITSHQATSVSKLARTMLDREISSMIILGTDGKLEGIVMKTDLCVYYATRISKQHKVDEFMSPDPVSVSPYHSVSSLLGIMATKKFQGCLL